MSVPAPKEILEMKNAPSIKLGIVAVSRDCFPIELSRKRVASVLDAAKTVGLDLIPC